MVLGLSLMFMKDLMAYQSLGRILSHFKVACLSQMVSVVPCVLITTTAHYNTPEPGFYEDGAFGVRIENVELIKKVKTKYVTADSLTMEPLTLVCSFGMK